MRAFGFNSSSHSKTGVFSATRVLSSSVTRWKMKRLRYRCGRIVQVTQENVLALAYQGINYTRRDRVLDVGPIHATKDTQEHISVPPIIGGLALVGGIVLLLAGGKRAS